MRSIAAYTSLALVLLLPASAMAEPNDPPSDSGPPSAPAAPSPGPTITGTAQQGQTLTGEQGDWSPGVSLTNDWRRCNEATCASTGETGPTYALTGDDVGKTIKLRVTGDNGLGFREADSGLTAVVTAPPGPPVAPANIVPPSISGAPREGQVLTAAQGSWSGSGPITYSYEWLRCAPTCSSTGATGITYPLTAADAKRRMMVRVTAVNQAGTAAASATSAVVAPLPKPPAKSAARRLSPFPVVIISGRIVGGTAVITTLAVRNAPRGATVTVRCQGPDCPVARTKRKLKRSSRMRLRAFEQDLRAGTVITILIRKGRALGKYTRIRIRRKAAPSRIDRCVKPGSQRPVSCPTP